MWTSIIALVVFLVLCFLVVDVKAQQIKRRSVGIPEETLPSPFSKSIAELVGIAGGIYLSLVMLVAFLGIEIPGKITVIGQKLDPLAFSSVVIALCQPFILEVYRKLIAKD